MSCVRPRLKGPVLVAIRESHFRRRGMDTLKGRLPIRWKLGGSVGEIISTVED